MAMPTSNPRVFGLWWCDVYDHTIFGIFGIPEFLDHLPQTSVVAVTGPYPIGSALGGKDVDKHAATWFPFVDMQRQQALPDPPFTDPGEPIGLVI